MQPSSLTAPPIEFLCPISLDVMVDPVTLPSGVTFDRPSIVSWFAAGHRSCPVSRQALDDISTALVPNLTLRRLIEKWAEANNRRVDVDGVADQSGAQSRMSRSDLKEARCILDDIVCGHNVRVASVRRLHVIARENSSDRESLHSVGADVSIAYLVRPHTAQNRKATTQKLSKYAQKLLQLSVICRLVRKRGESFPTI